MSLRITNKFRKRLTVVTHDLLMIPIAWIGAYWLRFNLGEIPNSVLQQALYLIPVVFLVQGFLFNYFGLYRGVWRFASIPDLMRIIKAVLAGVALSAVAIFFLTRLQDVPRSVFILDAVLLVLLLGGPRFAYRWFTDRRLYGLGRINVLVVGAGKAGEMLVHDLLRDPTNEYRPVGFVDDDPLKQGIEIHGVRVLDSLEAIPVLSSDNDIKLILIALPSASSKMMQRAVTLCEQSAVPFRSLPKMQDLISGKISVNDLREVRIEDLLGRETVSVDWPLIKFNNKDKTILVTGGGGSIGSELCRQVARLKIEKLIIYEQGEYNLFAIEQELKRYFPELKIKAILADITDRTFLEKVFSEQKPDIVFHAAAYKHVPLLEDQFRTATANNVIGTKNVADMAAKYNCGTFVMISTDKAVNPGNLMGTTKRAAEIYCQSMNETNKTNFITVRFGNVLGSVGSVIPIFEKQIKAGGPVTVTHPDITRFFMTIPEASQLILEATTIGKGGEILVLDMGEPVKISYLAKQMIRLSGKKPGEDIEIIYTGLRPGEKMYEELFHNLENMEDTRHPKIKQASARVLNRDEVIKSFARMEQACNNNDEHIILEELDKLVPERSNGSNAQCLQNKTQSNVVQATFGKGSKD